MSHSSLRRRLAASLLAAAATLLAPVGRATAATIAARPPTWLEAIGHFARTHALSAVVAAVLTYLCCHPLFAFCGRGWKIKREDIRSSLGSKAKLIYLQTFVDRDQAKRIDSDAEAVVEFDRMYRWRYGRYRLIAPTVLLVVVVATLALGLAETAVAIALGAAAARELVVFPLTATAAISGAYAWVVYDLIKSSARYDLPPSTVLGSALRLAIAVPLGYAVSALVSAPLGPFIAFAVGAFPLATIELVLKRVATNLLKLDLLPDSQPDQVRVLDGVDTLTADRLALAGVTTVCELAYCDPVQLSMRTNLAFDAVLNFVNQALAYIYLGPRMNDLRVVGLRGAVEIRHLGAELADGAAHAKPALTAAIAAANASVDAKTGYTVDEAGLRRAFHEIGEDPRTVFLEEVWESNAKARGEAREPQAPAPVAAPITVRSRPFILRPRSPRRP